MIPKLFGKIVYLKVGDSVSYLIVENQHGFLRGRSTSTNLLSITQYVSDIVEDKGQVDVSFTDFSKAFDVVIHNLLIAKISGIGIQGKFLDEMASFHVERIQKVKIIFL